MSKLMHNWQSHQSLSSDCASVLTTSLMLQVHKVGAQFDCRSSGCSFILLWKRHPLNNFMQRAATVVSALYDSAVCSKVRHHHSDFKILSGGCSLKTSERLNLTRAKWIHLLRNWPTLQVAMTVMRWYGRTAWDVSLLTLSLLYLPCEICTWQQVCTVGDFILCGTGLENFINRDKCVAFKSLLSH